eukprot:TRINITY_DN18247_c0_g1_i1.p1 TRINITY_DN18247_c0_g1~~TRINITY_DN18247_c0_g1_i1.p1  ORF type:complete len:1127 (+),score=441.15 TRINITY_DN18247_c0_g1_i1:109-3381(+)
MSSRRRSLSDGAAGAGGGASTIAERELVRHLQAQLERSGELGRGLLQKVDELTASKGALEDQVTTLAKHNQMMTLELGKVRSEKRSLSVLCNKVLEANAESETNAEALLKERERLQRYIDARCARAARGRHNSEPVLCTPRDIRLTPRDAAILARAVPDPTSPVQLHVQEETLVSLPTSAATTPVDAGLAAPPEAPEAAASLERDPTLGVSPTTDGCGPQGALSMTDSAPGEALSDLLGMGDGKHFGLRQCSSSKSPSPTPEEEAVKTPVEVTPAAVSTVRKTPMSSVPRLPIRGANVDLGPSTAGGGGGGSDGSSSVGSGRDGEVRPPSLPPAAASVRVEIPPESLSPEHAAPVVHTPSPKKKRSLANLLGLSPGRRSKGSAAASPAAAVPPSMDLLNRVNGGGTALSSPRTPSPRAPSAQTPPFAAAEKKGKKHARGASRDSDCSEQNRRTPPRRGGLPPDAAMSTGGELSNGSFPSVVYSPKDGDASPPAKQTQADALRSWARQAAKLETGGGGAGAASPSRVSVDDVSKKLTEAADHTPSLEELIALAREEETRQEREKAAHARARSCSATPEMEPLPDAEAGSLSSRHSTTYHLKQVLRALQREMKNSGGSAAATAMMGGAAGLRKIEKEIAVLLDRFVGPSTTFFMEIVIRDYQQLRILEGELHVFLHELAREAGAAPHAPAAERAEHEAAQREKLDKIRYQAALIRQQKVVIRQKRFILQTPRLRLFYAHLTKCLTATLMLLRILKFYPIGVDAVPRGSRRFLEFLYETLPHSVVLFEAGACLARPPEPKGRYNMFTLADVDALVDAVGLALCRRHEQQLNMLTADEGGLAICGSMDAADWIVGVVAEAIRQGRPNPVFPISDQIIAWTTGRELEFDEALVAGGPTPRRGARASPRLQQEPIEPLPDADAIGWRVPPDGLVNMAPPSDHLSWTAEGIFRATGVRTIDGELYGIEGCDRDVSWNHYGFATDTAAAARQARMTEVSSLLWGAHPSRVWGDDQEFMQLNPILGALVSPVTYTLLGASSVSQGLLAGGALEFTPPLAREERADKRGAEVGEQSWSSRTGVVNAGASSRLSVKGGKRR